MTAPNGGAAGGYSSSGKRSTSSSVSELDDAERNNDPGRAERARAEMDALTEQLAAAVGLGGRDRQAASASERARWTVSKAVEAALNRISDHHAVLGRYLTTSIKTGTFCSYVPGAPPPPWAF